MSAIPSLGSIPVRYSATNHANAPETPNRKLILLIVTLAHAGVIAAILLVAARPTRERIGAVELTSLVLLPTASAPSDAPRVAVHVESLSPSARILSEIPLPALHTDGSAITLPPPDPQRQPIDWDHEAALAVDSSLAQSEKERSYRNWSGPSPEQLEWLKKNHMEPAPPGFHWDRNSRRDLLRHGIFKINDYCVLVVALPFCSFGGKIQYDGDLFENMRDPKPLN